MLGSRPIWRVLVDVGDASWRLWLPVIMIIRNQPTTRSTSPWQHRNQSKVPLNPIQFAFTFVQRSFAVNSLNRYHLFGQVWVPFLIRSTMNGDDQEEKEQERVEQDDDEWLWHDWMEERYLDLSARTNDRFFTSSSQWMNSIIKFSNFCSFAHQRRWRKMYELVEKTPFPGVNWKTRSHKSHQNWQGTCRFAYL